MKAREARDFNVAKTQWVGSFILIGLLMVLSLVYLRQKNLVSQRNQIDQSPLSSPRAQIEFESGELRENLDSAQDKNLHSYRWMNSEKSAAHIPIERAMDWLSQQKSSDSLFKGVER